MKTPHWNPTVYYETFTDFLQGISAFGDSPAICYADENGQMRSHSYRTLCADVAVLRRALNAHSLAEKRVAIVGENSYEWLVLFFAVVSSGGVAICVDIEQNDNTIRSMIKQADAQVVFASPSLLPICMPMLGQNADIQCVFSLTAPESDTSVGGTFGALYREGIEIKETEPPALTPEQPAVLIFTSGTTAEPKGVVLTHRNLLQNAGAAVATVDLGQSIFVGLPFFHAYGLNCGVICSLLKGARLTINGNLATMLRDLALSESETVIAVPLMVEALYNSVWAQIRRAGREEEVNRLLKRFLMFRKFKLTVGQREREQIRDQYFGHLRLIVCGGAHMNTDISRQLEALGVLVLQGYGITECSPLISVNRNLSWNLESVGILLPGYEMKLVDGEIMVRGPSVMGGYYKDPEATAAVLQDGWFRTGDLGSRNARGHLFITGRTKNLIVLKNGKKISPEKLEEMVLTIPMVKDALVYGVVSGGDADDVQPAVNIYPDPKLTEHMEDYEVLGALQHEIDRLNSTLPAYQQLQVVNLREREFTKTSSMKIKRYAAENRNDLAVK